MKPADFIVRIPEPCHEDWNKMQPDAKGRFCSSCSKSVFDFTNKTDSEIKHILIEHKDKNVCGHFKKTQIDRPLDIRLDLNKLPKNISVTRTFALALFLVFGSLLFSCKDEKGNEIPVETMTQHVMGLSFALPQAIDSSYIIAEETPIDSTEYFSETYETAVDGTIAYEYLPEPPPPPPVEVIAGGISYYYFEADSAVVSNDSLTNESKRVIAEQLFSEDAKIFSVYPNPSSGEFTIQYTLLKRMDVKINIFNMSGALVKEVTNINGQYDGQYRVPVSVNELPNGIYIVNMIYNGEQSTERMVIAR